jgi:hypothetical protein
MRTKILFLTLLILIFAVSGSCLAQNENQTQNFIPQPLIDLFNIFSNWKIDFSRIPLINKIPEYLPRSGEDVGRSFQRLSGGLSNFNNWLTSHIGLNVILVIKKVGEFFVWALEFLVKLIKIGLSYLR